MCEHLDLNIYADRIGQQNFSIVPFHLPLALFSQDQITPLLAAAQRGHGDVVERLIKAHVEVDVKPPSAPWSFALILHWIISQYLALATPYWSQTPCCNCTHNCIRLAILDLVSPRKWARGSLLFLSAVPAASVLTLHECMDEMVL